MLCRRGRIICDDVKSSGKRAERDMAWNLQIITGRAAQKMRTNFASHEGIGVYLLKGVVIFERDKRGEDSQR